MEICWGNFLLFLTILMCSTCIVAQTTNMTEPSINQTTTENVTATPVPTNPSIVTTNSLNENSTELNNSTMNITATTPSIQTMETTTVVMRDYCTSDPCVNGNCSNGSTSYVCICDQGFTGTNCEEKLLLFENYGDYGWSSTSGSSPDMCVMRTAVPFPYFDKTVDLLFVSSRGYASFGEWFYSANAPVGIGWPYAPSLFGVYWTDFDDSVNQSFSFSQNLKVRNVSDPHPVFEYIKSVVNEPDFIPLHMSIVTWTNMSPNIANKSSYGQATFQLILTTDSQFSYAIKTYQRVLRNTDVVGGPLISTDYTREHGTRVPGDVPTNLTTLVVKLFSSGKPNKEPLDCVQKAQDVQACLGAAISSLPFCPCHLALASTDGWFESDNSTSACYLSILSDTEGLKQKCCYNRYGLLITNTPEADIPVETSASGTTLQSAFNQCCTAVPQMCNWFFTQFPTSNCSLYTPPFIAGTLGSMHFVTFDNNKFTFYGVGDFVLYKSGDVEVQMRAQRNGNANTTSLEALAVRIADNTSSFQFYLHSGNPVWNLTSGQGNTPVLGTYLIEQSELGSTLRLPTVIVTVTKMTGVLSYIIRTNSRDLNSEGLLGSVDGRADNDFKYRNGTLLPGTAEQLGADSISSVAQTWHVLNATESLFTYPGARPYDEANNAAGFTPLYLPTTVNDTLEMFADANKTIEAAEAENLCGGELFCLQEYYFSNDNTSAVEVLNQTKAISVQKEQSAITAPKFLFLQDTIRINAKGLDYSLNLNPVNPIDAEFSFVKDDFPDTSATMSTTNKRLFLWNVNADLAKLRALTYPRNLKFYATNAAKLSAEYAPTINLCLCELSTQCDSNKREGSIAWFTGTWKNEGYFLNNDVVNNGNVNNMLCNCNGTAGGKFCEKKLDVCLNCYNYTACDASKANYCAPCPAGFAGDGKSCRDIDECAVNNGGCDHFCTNSQGSFSCSCRPGYTQNGPRCTDINECLQNVNICNDALKMCANLPGTYTCSCLRGLVGRDTCIRAPYSFTGEFNLTDSGSQSWNPRLADTNSNEFKDLSKKVIKSIMDALIFGNIATNSTAYVEVLSFKQVQNAARTKRQASTSNTHISAKFVISTSDDNITADSLKDALNKFKSPDCNTSCQYGEIILYSDAPDVDSTADLCSYPQIHRCDSSTSYCEQSQQTTSCECKMGFEYSTESLSCRDKDECAENSNKTCPETGVCMNTFGSYECACSAGKIWDTNTTKCVADVCSTNPCKNDGVCFALNNHQDFACKCGYGWEGQLCDDEDSEAYRMKVAVICVSVILGVCCLVLFIVIIVICIRHRRSLENDSYTNSRYSEAEHLPRAKISQRPGTEMTENGSSYEKLNSGHPDDRQAAFGRHSPTPGGRSEGNKNVYQNKAFESELGERL